MINVDATVMLFSDSQQQRASAYHRGEAADIIALLVVAGIDDPDFGHMILHASLRICDELEKRKLQPAEVEEAQAKKERRDKNLKILLREED